MKRFKIIGLIVGALLFPALCWAQVGNTDWMRDSQRRMEEQRRQFDRQLERQQQEIKERRQQRQIEELNERLDELERQRRREQGQR